MRKSGHERFPVASFPPYLEAAWHVWGGEELRSPGTFHASTWLANQPCEESLSKTRRPRRQQEPTGPSFLDCEARLEQLARPWKTGALAYASLRDNNEASRP